MRRAVVVGIAGLALLGGGSISRPDAISAPLRLEGATFGGPLLGIVHQNGTSKLARIDARSLRPLRGRRVAAPGAWSWAFSPDRSRIVLALTREGRTVPRSSLRFVDVRRMRAVGNVPLGIGGVNRLAWLASDRLLLVQQLCCGGTFDVVVVAPRATRVLERRTLEGEPVSIAATPHELVVLAAPPRGIGPSRLLVFDGRGRGRSVEVGQIWSGRDVPEEVSGPFVARHRYPGFAVDPEGRRAFLASADGSIAAVDLRSLEIEYRTPTEPRSLLGRVLDWLEPAAQAKASDGTSRHALWLGAGSIAVTGSDDHTFHTAEGALSMRTVPAGLSLIDTGSWTIRRIDEAVSHVRQVGSLLLATGYTWDATAQREGGIGLAGYALDGRKRFHLFPGKNLTRVTVHGSRAYVGFQGTVRVGATHIRLDDGSVFKTVDLASGQIVGTRTAPIPMLLVDDATR